MAKFDNDLIFLFSENARAKVKNFSVILKKSPQRLKYSMDVLSKEDIIKYPYCVFDYSLLGLLLFRVYFKGGYVSEKDKKSIISILNENPYVVSTYELSGEFDLVVEIEASNPSRFNKELKKIVDQIPTLNNYKISLNIVTHIYSREYLLNNQALLSESHQITLGGDRDPEKFDENQIEVMSHLLTNPKMRFSALAKNSGLNVKTVMSAFKELKKKNMIKGFKHELDTHRMGISRQRLFIKLHNVSQEREKQLMDYFYKTKEIVQVNRTVGDWDLEIDVESFDRNIIRSMIVGAREEFKDLIVAFNTIEFYKCRKKAYLPSYLFLTDHKELK